MSKNRQFNYLGIRRASGCTKNPEGGGLYGPLRNFSAVKPENMRGSGWTRLMKYPKDLAVMCLNI